MSERKIWRKVLPVKFSNPRLTVSTSGSSGMSKLKNVLESFGFAKEEQQIAFLENLVLAGYFEDKKLWQMVHLINFDQNGQKSHFASGDEAEAFEALKKVCSDSKDPNRSTKYLLEHLFESDNFDPQDVEDMVLHLGQSAFARVYNQERSELQPLNLKDSVREDYLKNAATLGLVEQINPVATKFDETWIQGAARCRMKSRLEYCLSLRENIDLGVIKFRTGDRELWLEIDKMPEESFEETKAFFLELAECNFIAVDPENQFEKRSNGRTYLKYAEGETRKITEDLAAQFLLDQCSDNKIENIVDSKVLERRSRPDTESGANASYDDFVKAAHFPSDRKPAVLIVSNQPYCLRQLEAVQSAIAKKSGKEDCFELEVAGEKSSADVTAIHSEFGALIAELYLKKVRQFPAERKRSLNQMTYSERLKTDLEIGETFSHHPTTKIVKPLAAQVAAELMSSLNDSEIETSRQRER